MFSSRFGLGPHLLDVDSPGTVEPPAPLGPYWIGSETGAIRGRDVFCGGGWAHAVRLDRASKEIASMGRAEDTV